MKTAKLNRTIRFKFGKGLRKGLLVQLVQTNENTCMVRKASESTLEYLVSKDALDIVPTPNDQRDLQFKDDGNMLTLSFMSDKIISGDFLKNAAKDLVDDVNMEYNRGICELIASLYGTEDLDHADRAKQIAIELGLTKPIY